MEEIEHLAKELSRLIVKHEARLNPVLRSIRVQAALRALDAHRSARRAADVLGLSQSTVERIKRGIPDPEGKWDGRRQPRWQDGVGRRRR